MNDKFRLLTIGIACIFGSFPQISVAEEFKAEKVLTWNKAQQDNYFQTSITMAAFVAARLPTDHADCLNNWYYPNIEEKHKHIRVMLRKHSDFHPSAVILAVIEEACGEFN